MLKIQRTFEAYLDEMDKITVLLPHEYGVSNTFSLRHKDEKWDLSICSIINLSHAMKYECKAHEPLDLSKCYFILDERSVETDLQIGAVIRTEQFDEVYYYEGNDLGAQYTKEKTVCKIWAPTASRAKLRIYRDEQNYHDYEMTREEKGVWCSQLEGDFDGAQYMVLVCINLIWHEAVDPYTKSVTINGERGVIINMEKTYVEDKAILPSYGAETDAVIYEAHIRDMTMHPSSGVLQKGTYSGFIEERSKPLSYMKRLGVTHVELLPLHQFAGVDEEKPFLSYNWGYNPLFYNVPAGVYSLNPQDPYSRIIECKMLIRTIHEHGLRVILDVVYNHVFQRETSSFEKLVPGYYFRHGENGMPSNGTGVGNDVASERKMVRKFIVDSVLYWLTEYRLDGFRFDLMGILDIDTMNIIRKKVDEVKERVILLGEGWDLQTPLSKEKKAALYNAKQMPRIAQFNDRFRDTIKGSTFDVRGKGFAFGDISNQEFVQAALMGKGFDTPCQTINYVECHDNMTMWDKLLVSNDEEEYILKRRHQLATVMTILSQGVPFLHAGQEFYRTKQGHENSYNAPDEINQIDWERAEKEEKTIAYIEGIITLRKQHHAFRFSSLQLIEKHMSFMKTAPSVVAYWLQDVSAFGKWSDIVAVFHNGLEEQELNLPKKGVWHVIADDNMANPHPIFTFEGNKTMIKPVSSYVFVTM
ncbi:pullulanase [Bacillus manliponensis]|uniref:Pullulanase n=1 Tax=Bacillus manliponensis TaxID=574376 RepID=A0A073JW46_9BACI|nr:type I pullulanase [Bacillus manliponensis]KEK18431.1 pullulanase [Bacillus manliponensis]